jgi:hypothetical protein
MWMYICISFKAFCSWILKSVYDTKNILMSIISKICKIEKIFLNFLKCICEQTQKFSNSGYCLMKMYRALRNEFC